MTFELWKDAYNKAEGIKTKVMHQKAKSSKGTETKQACPSFSFKLSDLNCCFSCLTGIFMVKPI